jgi:putative addiction module killer protein
VFTIRQTDTYRNWFSKLKDKRAQSRVDIRIRRLSLGNAGDVKPVGAGVSELRINYGPEYRVYYTAIGDEIIILLAGGDKSTQSKDIEKAKELASNL